MLGAKSRKVIHSTPNDPALEFAVTNSVQKSSRRSLFFLGDVLCNKFSDALIVQPEGKSTYGKLFFQAGFQREFHLKTIFFL